MSNDTAAFLFYPRPAGAVHAAAQNMSLSVLFHPPKGRRSTDFHARRPVPGDRRKTELACTEKAQSIIEQGRRMQDDFIRRLMAGLEEEKLEIFFEVIDTMNENLDAILEGEE